MGFEREHATLAARVAELEAALAGEKAARQRVEARARNSERKGDDNTRKLRELEKENQTLTLKVSCTSCGPGRTWSRDTLGMQPNRHVMARSHLEYKMTS